MPKHYKNKTASSLAMPRDAAHDQNDYTGGQTQMYHMGKEYYGPGYGNPANMPMQPEISMYPKGRPYLNTGAYADTMSEIDGTAHSEVNNLNSQHPDSRY